jgi:hypothetical protein
MHDGPFAISVVASYGVLFVTVQVPDGAPGIHGSSLPAEI